MDQEQQQNAPDDADTGPNGSVQQQQQQPQSEGHAGHGADSVMKQLREWEDRRASNSGSRRRSGPN